MAPALTDLFTLCNAYAASTGLSEGTVSGRVLKSGGRIRSLRENRSDIGVRKMAEAIQWFSDHWPDGVEWPEGIDRPPPSQGGEGAA
jgi:hypothetical protein